MIRTTTIPAIVMVFPDPPEGFTGTVGGKPEAADIAGGVAGAAESCSRGVPQYSQNFLPEATSFPQDVQNGI
jgi:hypothetical protein